MRMWLSNKKADLELDELGKIILAVVLLVVLIVLVTVVIKGELSNQIERIKSIFSFF